jgi:hypothetical protein
MLRERGRSQRHVVRPESGPPPDLLRVCPDGAKILHGLDERSSRRLRQIVLPVDAAGVSDRLEELVSPVAVEVRLRR